MKNNRLVPFLLLALACVFGLSACATMKKSAAADPGAAKTVNAPDYILGPDDVVRINVEQHMEWSGEFTVRTDGTIYIQGVGEIRIAGLSKYGAEVVLTEGLSTYINNPKVSVDIMKYASQVIYVLGEVRSPGRFVTQGRDITVREAVVLAGLPTRFAATTRVYVISPSDKRPTQRVVNLERILNRGELKYDIKIYPGDIVYVPKTIWGHISDFVSSLLSPLQAVPAARTAATPM